MTRSRLLRGAIALCAGIALGACATGDASTAELKATKALLTDNYCCDSGGNIVTITYYNGPDATFISSLNVSGAKAAPEIDPASAASGLTLLLGGLAVLRGRRRISL